MCNDINNNTCIKEILNVILVLQENASCIDSTLDGCDRKFLGQCTTNCVCNTRPLMLYLCSCDSLTMPTEKDSTNPDSSVFRVEKLDNNCATFRVLKDNNGIYESTNSFFTVSLNCVCCIRCLTDTYIECI